MAKSITHFPSLFEWFLTFPAVCVLFIIWLCLQVCLSIPWQLNLFQNLKEDLDENLKFKPVAKNILQFSRVSNPWSCCFAKSHLFLAVQVSCLSEEEARSVSFPFFGWFFLQKEVRNIHKLWAMSRIIYKYQIQVFCQFHSNFILISLSGSMIGGGLYLLCWLSQEPTEMSVLPVHLQARSFLACCDQATESDC